MGYAFISYSHKDGSTVIQYIDRMRKKGYQLWYDDGIDPGTEWDENIAAHIDHCSYFIAFISNNYIQSNNCKDEVNYARDQDKNRLLIYLEDCQIPSGMAMRLNRLQSIYAYKYPNLDDAMNKIFSAKGIECCWSEDEDLSVDVDLPSSVSGDTAMISLTDAYQLYAEANYEEAFPALLYYAEQGEPRAQSLVGVCYQCGYSIEPDLPVALRWYQKAVENDDDLGKFLLGIFFYSQKDSDKDTLDLTYKLFLSSADAIDSSKTYLGLCYLEGKGVVQDRLKAVEWFKKAANAGDAAGQTRLANCYYDGIVVAKDLAEAYKWYHKAAEQRDGAALNKMGLCCFYGYGVDQSYADAAYWFGLGVEEEDADAENNLGACYELGYGVDRNMETAVSLYRKSAEQGCADGQKSLADCYYNGNGVEVDYSEAFRWYNAAAEQGNGAAMNGVGLCYYFGRYVGEDLREALKWFLLSADAGDKNGAFDAGSCYYHGNGTEIDYEKAVHYFQIAEQRGDTTSLLSLGKCYYYGQGVAKDTATALTYAQKAIDADIEDASAFLDEIKNDLRANGRCQYCGGAFTGLFRKKCVECGKAKDY